MAALARSAAQLERARDQSGWSSWPRATRCSQSRPLARSARGHDHVAPSLRGSVRALLAPLPGDARQLVELAAVAARSIEPLELERARCCGARAKAPPRRSRRACSRASDGRIGFRHALLREAAYAEIAEPRRRSLHLRWAQALLASEQAGGQSRPAEAARHLLLAGHGDDAVEQLARAAAHARAVAALEQAADYL